MLRWRSATLLFQAQCAEQRFVSVFRIGTIPRNRNVEAIPKRDVEKALRDATRQVAKGPYHKGGHSHELLKQIDPEKVKGRVPHCQRLFTAIGAELGLVEQPSFLAP